MESIEDEKTGELEELKVLPNTLSDDLLRAIKGFVYNKYLLDKVIREEGGFCFAGELGGDEIGPLEGPSFYRAVFPFAPVWESRGKRFSALVPTCQTVGCSWRWRSRHLSPEISERCLSLFTDPKRGSISGCSDEPADFMWIRPLGLVLPHEGKNRVDFLREKQVEMIPARVSEYDYPDASRIVLYKVKVHGQYQCWAVLDGRWVERLSHPSWAIPVLGAYGVPINQRWKPEFSAVQKVLEGFNHTTGNPSFLNKDIVDLERIVLESDRQQEVVLCSHMDLRAVRLRMKLLVWYCVASIFAFLIVITILPFTWLVNLGIFTGFVFGIGFGVYVLYFFPVFHTSRAVLDQDWPLVERNIFEGVEK